VPPASFRGHRDHKHRGTATYGASPTGIPGEILNNDFDQRQSYPRYHEVDFVARPGAGSYLDRSEERDERL
jgi:hypothetical protein